jgi:hypothetical protein
MVKIGVILRVRIYKLTIINQISKYFIISHEE